MQCTEILMKEHETILARVSQLEQTLESKVSENIEAIDKTIEFIQKYADEFHHAKEEDIYFKWMIDKNPMFEGGPIHCMLDEHNKGRSFIKTAVAEMDKIKSDPTHSEEQVKESLTNFIDLIRAHIDKENNVLYQMAEQVNADVGDGDEIMLPKFQSINEPTLT
ncbi:MAG: hypothetical protein HOE90_13130 [Bacteriovoracaceae bacterium]|jgi:hemerythrin-like domain-containing protein|nr:hypothetical protein [Bacteriovoracaceae bacterium]